MDASGDILLQPVGLKIQGASNRVFPKKRFILKADPKYGSQFFNAELFDGAATQSLMLKDKLPDAIVADLIPDRAVATQHSVPVRVYLNGEYWYDSFALERYDEQYFRQYYNVANRLLVKDGRSDAQPESEPYFDEFEELLFWWKTGDFSDAAEWEKLMNAVDMQSYIDYIVTNYYLLNLDFSHYHNQLMWRSPDVKASGQTDLRYRWCIYDIDAIYALPTLPAFQGVDSLASINTFHNGYADIPLRNTLYCAMRQNPEFNRQFVLSFMDMVNNNFAVDRVEQILKKYGETLDWMDGFFRLRPAYAMQHLAEEFQLTGALETVTISAANPEMGHVTVNTSTIDLSSGNWSGQYFTDYPITITAEPAKGYRFIGWKGGSVETDNSITVSVDGGITLEAVFAKK